MRSLEEINKEIDHLQAAGRFLMITAFVLAGLLMGTWILAALSLEKNSPKVELRAGTHNY